MGARPDIFKRIMLIIITIWTILLISFLIHDFIEHKNYAYELALKEAQVSTKKDLAYRSWISSHGGIYVPITERTPPNLYLSFLTDRDIETTTGKKLTLMNPASIITQIMEEYSNSYGVKVHITSKRILNPINNPDPWELKALDIIEKTQLPYYEKVQIDNNNFLRFLNPMFIQESCLKCHALQDYIIGELRGAVSVSIPMQAYEKQQESHFIHITAYLFIIWIIGMVGIFWEYKKSISYVKQQVKGYERHIYSLVDLIEKRDQYTAGHSQRVARYCTLIAQQMGYNDSIIEQLFRAAMLHDIGKISTPDSILLKPGKLSKLEYSLIQDHVTSGYELLKKVDIFQDLAEIIRHHHEHYDGSGYPLGLKEDNIPMLSQILTIADAFDSMTTDRVYKGRKSVDLAIEELQQLSGKQFHREAVNAASICLKDTKVDHVSNQLPKTRLEQERFSYFYKDSITGVYNREYLEFTLTQLNQDLQGKKRLSLKFIYAIYLHNFSIYNNNYSWHDGDKLLRKIARKLLKLSSDERVFRIFGDDFLIINEKQIDLEDKIKAVEELLKDTGVTVSFKQINLDIEKIHSIEELEKYF